MIIKGCVGSSIYVFAYATISYIYILIIVTTKNVARHRQLTESKQVHTSWSHASNWHSTAHTKKSYLYVVLSSIISLIPHCNYSFSPAPPTSDCWCHSPYHIQLQIGHGVLFSSKNHQFFADVLIFAVGIIHCLPLIWRGREELEWHGLGKNDTLAMLLLSTKGAMIVLVLVLLLGAGLVAIGGCVNDKWFYHAK